MTESAPDDRRAALSRVRALLGAAKRIVDPADELGVRARAVLPSATGLSPEGVALALSEYVETDPSYAELTALIAAARPADADVDTPQAGHAGVPAPLHDAVGARGAAYVVLSAGVFVGAHRAIALALARSDTVYVKPSRRDPEMVRLLAEAAPGLFTIVERIAPRAGDVVFAYGTDEALAAIRASLPVSVSFRGHGTGFGIAILDVPERDAEVARAAALVAKDVVPFDQRGCLSPRIVLVNGAEDRARAFSRAVAAALHEAEQSIPRGQISAEETAAAVRYRDTMRYAGEIFAAGSSLVGLDVRGERAVLPPVGRHVHVARVADIGAFLVPISRMVTVVGIHGAPQLAVRIGALVPFARTSAFGKMQKPAFDGPVDRRRPDAGEV